MSNVKHVLSLLFECHSLTSLSVLENPVIEYFMRTSLHCFFILSASN